MPNTLPGLFSQALANGPDRLAIADAPNRSSFFTGEPLRLSWSELDQAIGSVAKSLGDAEISAGDAVAIQLPNVVELAVSIMACLRLGAVATPFPVQHREHELRTGLEASGARHLITAARPDRPDLVEASQSVLDEFDAKLLQLGADLVIDGPSVGVSHEPAPDEVATICWTSGTTGVPKGVPRTHSMWIATSSSQVNALELNSDDRILCPFPLVNMAGIGGMLVPWLQTGGTLFLHNPIDLAVFLGQIGGEEITYTVAPPPLLNMLLARPAMLEGVDMSHIRKITSGSAPLDPWMVAGWQERGIEIVNAFGSNEGAAMLSTGTSVPDPELRARYFPRPTAPGIEVRIVDLATDTEVTEAGTPGELRFRGPTVFSGYLQSDGAEFDADGYYRTGDIFQIADADPNLLQFVDRAKDIIIRGGMNVSAAEVEALVSSHDAVAECSIVAYPDTDLGERVGVFVVAAPDAAPELDDIVSHLRDQNIASYKLPERLELIEQLPRNPVGKVVKGDLRDRWNGASA